MFHDKKIEEILQENDVPLLHREPLLCHTGAPRASLPLAMQLQHSSPRVRAALEAAEAPDIIEAQQ